MFFFGVDAHEAVAQFKRGIVAILYLDYFQLDIGPELHDGLLA